MRTLAGLHICSMFRFLRLLRMKEPEAFPCEASREARAPAIYPALMLALNAGMRNGEIRHLRWNQVDLKKEFLTVGRSKTEASGRSHNATQFCSP